MNTKHRLPTSAEFIQQLCAEVSRLTAELAELRLQKPVGWMDDRGDMCQTGAPKYPRHVFPLYARPVPAAQAVPEIKPRLIGWRTENYLLETDDIDKARNWEPNIGVLPIFEGDQNTKLAATEPKEELNK